LRHAHTRWRRLLPCSNELAVVLPRSRAGSRNSQVCTLFHMDAWSYGCSHTVKFPCSFMHLVQFARSCSIPCMFGVHTTWFVCSFTHAIYVWVPHSQSCVHWCTVYHACVVLHKPGHIAKIVCVFTLTMCMCWCYTRPSWDCAHVALTLIGYFWLCTFILRVPVLFKTFI